MSVLELHFLAHPVNVRKSRRGSSDATAAAAAAANNSSSSAGAVGFVNKGWNLLQDVFTTEQAKVAANGARKSRFFRTHIVFSQKNQNCTFGRLFLNAWLFV